MLKLLQFGVLRRTTEVEAASNAIEMDSNAMPVATKNMLETVTRRVADWKGSVCRA